jgi:hypothetical protein
MTSVTANQQLTLTLASFSENPNVDWKQSDS